MNLSQQRSALQDVSNQPAFFSSSSSSRAGTPIKQQNPQISIFDDCAIGKSSSWAKSPTHGHGTPSKLFDDGPTWAASSSSSTKVPAKSKIASAPSSATKRSRRHDSSDERVQLNVALGVIKLMNVELSRLREEIQVRHMFRKLRNCSKLGRHQQQQQHHQHKQQQEQNFGEEMRMPVVHHAEITPKKRRLRLEEGEAISSTTKPSPLRKGPTVRCGAVLVEGYT
jgi:hypothetical protein